MDRMLILRQLLPGLAPLIVFVIADEIWGTHVGLMVAMGFGLVELGVSLARKKRPDKFLLLDLGLIMAMGGVSLWLDNDVFFKLKPVVIGGVMCAMMAAMAYLPGNMLQAMQQRYMGNLQINPWQQYEFKRSIARMVWVLVAHTAITLATVFVASNTVWGLVSGPGFFVAAAVWMAWEFIVKKQQKKRFANEEWLPLVDEQGTVLGSAPRSVVHGGSMLLHPVVHLHVVTTDGIYLQKRPMFKQVQPGKWDTAVGGHISAGESVDKALLRETSEEIGLTSCGAF
jgi:intracellular septation protein A